MPAEAKNAAPSRFFGKSKDGTPCVIYDAVAVQTALDHPNQATYTAAPVQVSYSQIGENKTLRLSYPSEINPDQLPALNESITHTPYVTVYELQEDSTFRKRWFHATGNAVIGGDKNEVLEIPFDTNNTVITTPAANPITTFLFEKSPDDETSSTVYPPNYALNTIKCYVTPVASL